jgi:hypothetical protein
MTQLSPNDSTISPSIVDIAMPIQAESVLIYNNFAQTHLEEQLQEFLDEVPILRFTVLREADGTFLFSDEMAAAFALGDTFREAVASYLETVQDVFEVMSEGGGSLLAKDRRKLECLRELLE